MSDPVARLNAVLEVRRVLLVASLLFLPLGCGGDDDPSGPPLVLQPSELCSDHADAAIATFEDANLEQAVRDKLSVGAQEDLTCGLVSGLTRLDTRPALIESLVGVQNLTGLTSVNLNTNAISDISALSGLTSLRSLRLSDNPNLTDIKPLLDNTGLGVTDSVHLEGTSVSCTDVTALRAKGVQVSSDCG